MKLRSSLLLALLVVVLGLSLVSCAKREESAARVPEPSTPKPVVAIFNLLSHPILDASVKGIKAGLAANGYTQEHLVIREVNANGEMDKLDAFSRELLGLRPDVIIPVATPVAQAVVKAASPNQNIVFSTVTNPSDVGIDERPANLTGVSDAVNYEANIALLAELFPRARRIGVIYNPGERNSEYGMTEVRRIARARNLELIVATVASGGEVQDAARGLVSQVDAFYVGSDNTVVGAFPALLKVANERKKPVLASDSGSVEQGALAAVSVDYEKLGRRVGEIVADVLKNKKMAGEIKNVLFTGDSLVINEDTARGIGYEFPSSVVSRATRVVGAK